MIEKKNMCVYVHRNPKTKNIFCIGSGSKERPYDFKLRTDRWKEEVSKIGIPLVEIIKTNLSEKEASKLKLDIVKKWQ